MAAPAQGQPEAPHLRRRRLRFLAARRGLLEVELALRPLVEGGLAACPADQLPGLEELLSLPDLDLWEVICGRRPWPAGLAPGLRRLLARGPFPPGVFD